MSGRAKIVIGIGLLVSLIWIAGFMMVDGASWREVADFQVEDYYLQCINQKRDLDACDAERDPTRDELYSGIPWGGITFMAVAPAAIGWAVGLGIWLVRRRFKPNPSGPQASA
jgi:hypothetical protein